MERRPRLVVAADIDERSDHGLPATLAAMLRNGLALLWRAHVYSRGSRCVERFCVDIESLYRAGITRIDLRWLLLNEYLEEVSVPSSAASIAPFEQSSTTVDEFGAQYFLTAKGVRLASDIVSRSSSAFNLEAASDVGGSTDFHFELRQDVPPPACVPSKPKWDTERRELQFQNWIVKQYKWSATNQEAVLMAFEEEGWPSRIDDPLPQKENQDPKQRLHDTIKCLNRNHKKRLIRFLGDGTGEGVLWLPVDQRNSDR